MNTLRTVKEILPVTLDRLGLRKRYNEQTILYKWQEIAGEEIYVHSRASSLHRGILFLTVDNSVWCHHLSMMKNQLIERVNGFFQQNLISDIRFKAGILKNYQNFKTDKEKITIRRRIKAIPLSQEEKDKAAALSSSIKNAYFRKKINTLIEKDIVLKKYRQAYEHWKKCRNCEALCPPDADFCIACGLKEKEQKIYKIRTILLEVPWLDYDDIQEYVECSDREYYSCRNALIEKLGDEIRKNPENCVPVITIIMLQRRLKPDEIQPVMIENTQEFFRRKRNVSSPRS